MARIRFNKNWGVELGLDSYDFDKIETKHQAIHLSAVYRFVADSWIHPIAKLGLGMVETKNLADDKMSNLGAKAAVGLEIDFKYVSVGGLLNYFYNSKEQSSPEVKNAQALSPTAFITIHNAVEYDKTSQSKAPPAENKTAETASAAESAKQLTAEEILASKDTDGDGVNDLDDKCPNTPANVVVNSIGCAETEKASVKLNVEFATGKSDVDPKFENELNNLVNFMKKFPETKVTIEGHSDNTGSEKINTTLSQKRADSVSNYLIQHGIEKSRLTAKGFGPSRPIADNKTVESRQTNRRVMAEISVTTVKHK